MQTSSGVLHFDPSLEDEMRVTIIATGFNKENYHKSSAGAVALPKEEVKTEAPEAEKADAEDTVYDPVKDNEIGEGTMPEIKEEVLSENDFDDILNILKKTNRRDDVRRR